MEKLFTMTLGEVTSVGSWEVTRVPGGWIFVLTGSQASPVFVPYCKKSFNDTLNG